MKIEEIINKYTKPRWEVEHDGKIETVSNLHVYCTKNNLNYNTMCKVVKGKLKKHKGFTCRKV